MLPFAWDIGLAGSALTAWRFGGCTTGFGAGTRLRNRRLSTLAGPWMKCAGVTGTSPWCFWGTPWVDGSR